MQVEDKIVSKNAAMSSLCGDQSIPDKLVSVNSGSMCPSLQAALNQFNGNKSSLHFKTLVSF